jgi:hypothetical protein
MKKLARVLKSSIFWSVGFTASVLISWILYNFTNLELTRNNFWITGYYYEIITSILTIILTGIVFGLTAYKMMYFSHPNKLNRRSESLLHWFLSAIWTFLSILVTGCPACSITIATYIGLSSIITFLPFLWYELRVFGILITLWAIWAIWKNLETCALKK